MKKKGRGKHCFRPLFYMLQSDGIPECRYFSFQQAENCSSQWHAALREHSLCKCVCVCVHEWKPPLTMVWHEMSCVFRALHSCLIVSHSTAGRIIAMIRRRPFVQTRESSLFSFFGREGRWREVGSDKSVLNKLGHSIDHSFSVVFLLSIFLQHFSLSFASSLHPSYLFFFSFYYQTQWHPHTDTQTANFEVLMKWQLHASLSLSGFYWCPYVAQ